MQIVVPAGAPQFLSKLAREIEGKFVSLVPTRPVRIPSYASDNLPKASDHQYGLIFVSDLNKPAISNGVAWISLTLGSVL